MARFKKGMKSPGAHHDDAASDSVSELSADESSLHSNVSKSSAFARVKFMRTGKFGKKKTGDTTDGTASVGSTGRSGAPSSNGGVGRTARTAPAAVGRDAASAPPASPGGISSNRSVGSAGGRSRATARSGGMNDEKRLAKDAKSRFNIGLVYLKTGDYAKAQDNLEHSLYCHIQLSGHDAKAYSNETLFAVAGVREKLGDCYLGNSAIVDKCLALDHYEESRRLLRGIDPEDAPDKVSEMLERIEEKLKSPELRSGASGGGGSRRPPPAPAGKYQMQGNDKAKALLGVGAAGAAAGKAASPGPSSPSGKDRGGHGSAIEQGFAKIDVLGVGKKIHRFREEVHEFATEVKEGILDAFDSSTEDGDDRTLTAEDAYGFDAAMQHLERANHRTALNHLTSMQEGGSMKNEFFRAEMAAALMKVADGALEAEKVSVATDAYEEAYSVLKQDEASSVAGGSDNGASRKTVETPQSEALKRAMRGCIRGHKLLAMETEEIRDYGSAIQHRQRVYQLLDEDNRCVPACQQLVRIAYLQGEKDDYAKCAVSLSDAVRRLFKGVNSIDMMAQDRKDLLVQCYRMRAVCYSKTQKWSEAAGQYDEILPLIEKSQGKGGKDYNSALIQKSALLVMMGNHRLASATVNKYLQLAELNSESQPGRMIVSDTDHILALDTSAATHLKLGNVDGAIAVFQKKLAFVKTLPPQSSAMKSASCPKNEEMKSDTMHKLGCLLAYKKEHEQALPLLNEALDTRKFLYDGKHRSVFETTWAVAATTHTLGDTERALKEYSVLLDKINKVEDSPIDSVMIQNSAGKLFFEDGKTDKAVESFRLALQGSDKQNNPQLKAEIMLNLANALSARGEFEKAMELYDALLGTRALKKTKTFFLTLYNKSLLMIKMGEVEEAKGMLNKIAETRSSAADEVRGSIYLTLGSLAVSDGKTNEALDYYEKALDFAEPGDIKSQVHAKKSIAMAYFLSGQSDRAISTFDEILEDLSETGAEGKAVNILKAEVWICKSRVYKQKGDLAQAKHFAKLGE